MRDVLSELSSIGTSLDEHGERDEREQRKRLIRRATRPNGAVVRASSFRSPLFTSV